MAIGSKDKVPEFIKKVKGGEGRLMGFGHRVYKNYDPRATIIKQIADQVFEVKGRNPLLDIALELEPFRLSLLNSVDAMARFVDECSHPRIRANIDISHLVLSDTSASDLKKLKGKAIHVHLSDCDGKVHGDLPPGRGVVKFAPYLQAIKELNIPNGVVSIELEYAPDPKKIVEWVEEAYRQTDHLMQAAGLRG